ncbi:uncharacterized protein VB005_00472 [Metarhizium brunneum]
MALVLGLAAPPSPTPAPDFHPGLFRRQNVESTCGYISGVEAESLTCDDGDWCQVDTVSSLFGCCSSDCVLVSECIPYSSSSETATVTIGDLGIIYCNDSKAPDCAVAQYVGGRYSGYTAPFCFTKETTVSIFATFSTAASDSGSGTGASASRTLGTSQATSPDSTSSPSTTPKIAAPTTTTSNQSNGGKLASSILGVVLAAVTVSCFVLVFL